MNHHHRLTRTIVGAVLSGGIALTGLGLASATAHATPQTDASDRQIIAVAPQSSAASEKAIIAVNPNPAAASGKAIIAVHPQSPAVRAGFDPQPEPPAAR